MGHSTILELGAVRIGAGQQIGARRQAGNGPMIAMLCGSAFGAECDHYLRLLGPNEEDNLGDDALGIDVRELPVTMAAELHAVDPEDGTCGAELRLAKTAEFLPRRNGDARRFAGISVGRAVQRATNALTAVLRDRRSGCVGLIVRMGEDRRERSRHATRISDGGRPRAG